MFNGYSLSTGLTTERQSNGASIAKKSKDAVLVALLVVVQGEVGQIFSQKSVSRKPAAFGFLPLCNKHLRQL